MIKYLELTAPKDELFRQAKIESVEVSEGEAIYKGSTLFIVKVGRNKYDLPSTIEGKVSEVIVTVGENITLSTSLLLVETQVEGSTASKQVGTNNDAAKNKDQKPVEVIESKPAAKTPTKTKKTASKEKTAPNKAAVKKEAKKLEQQSLDLGDDLFNQKQSDNESDAYLAKIKQEQIKDQSPVPDSTSVNTSDTPTKSETMSANSIIKVAVPDIGADSAKVIEILVNVGDSVSAEDPLVTLESDKASMDVPSTHAGVIKAVSVSVDQDISEGTVVVELEASEEASPAENASPATPPKEQPASPAPATPQPVQKAAPAAPSPAVTSPSGKAHASPSIRRFARELGVDLAKVGGSGRKGRISKDDVKGFVKGIMTSGASSTGGGMGIEPIPAQDFTKFGEIEVQALNKIKRLTASNLHRAWLNVPHVTHNDESNINDLEAFRKTLNAEYAKRKKDIKLSPLAFIVKAVVNALQTYPQFNSSLEPGGENLILKKYYNIGIAVETPNGLVVPVIKDADKLSVAEIATEMGNLAAKARDKKLSMADMSGACFTISSLGGIGGTNFTPIVNAPEVAILGVARSKVQPVWNGSEFEPGMMLPLSLSYDHRVIDGAEAARFTRHIAALLEDIRRMSV